ncbi:MAG: hypothetical protein KIT31_19990 [Deltaproteobacteria bacterium]|nr:hypothetical protein [Deltaproteobacteria bacterium]
MAPIPAPATIVAPAPAPVVGSPPAHTPLPPAPMPRWSGHRRQKSDTIQNAFDAAINEQPATAGPAKTHGVSTAEDLAAVRGVFNEVAAVHVTQVRDVMLELRYGDADAAWIESTRPALQSLRQMASQLELADLCQALDDFVAGVEAAVANKARLGDAEKHELLRRYQKLIELIPAAFELDAERDRREPIIIEALLNQVAGVERRTIDKLFSIGLNRLDAFVKSTAEEISVVSGISLELATAIVAQFTSYRVGAQAAVAARDPVAERRHLHDLLITMSLQNDDFVHASSRWSADAVAKKREARRLREQTYQRIRVALARLGEKDLLGRLEPLSFKERIAMLDRYLSAPRQT